MQVEHMVGGIWGAQMVQNSSLALIHLPESSHTSYHQAVAGECAGFVKAANLDLACKGDAEWLRAVHICARGQEERCRHAVPEVSRVRHLLQVGLPIPSMGSAQSTIARCLPLDRQA